MSLLYAKMTGQKAIGENEIHMVTEYYPNVTS